LTESLVIGFDAKRAFANVTGLGNYSRFVLRTLTRRFPEHQYVLCTPRMDRDADMTFLDSVPRAEIAPAPKGLAAGLGAAVWRTFFLGRHADARGVSLFHGLSQELPRDLPKRVRAVVSQADVLYLRYPELFPAIDRAFYQWKYRWSCERADRIVAISEQTKRDLAEFYGIEGERVRVVYPGCDLRFSERVALEQKAAVRRRYGLPEDYVLSVGTIEERKNALIILRALATMPPAERPFVALVGRPTRYRQVLDDFARRHALSSGMRVIYPVPQDDLPALYQGARLFIYPSRFEGFGLPILEALRSGVPVVTSTGSCFAEAGGAAARYVSPDDPAAVADAIRTVLGDSDLANAMIAEGRRHAATFDDDALAERLMDVYTESLCAT